MVISGTVKKIFSTFDGSAVHTSLRWSSNCRFILHRLVRSMEGCMQADQGAGTFFFLLNYLELAFREHFISKL